MGTIEVPLASLKSVLEVVKFQNIHFKSLERFAKKQSMMIEEMKTEKLKLQKRIRTLESENEKLVDLEPFVDKLKELNKIMQFQALHIKSLAKNASRKENIVKKLSVQVEEKVKSNNSLLKEVETLKISSQFHKGELEKSQGKCCELERKIEKLKQEIHNQNMMSGSLNPMQTSFIPGLDTSVSHNDVSFCLTNQRNTNNAQPSDFVMNGTSSMVSSIPDQSNDSFCFLPMFQNSRSTNFISDSGEKMPPPKETSKRRNNVELKDDSSFKLLTTKPSSRNTSLLADSMFTPTNQMEPTVLASFDSSGRRRTPTKFSTPLMPGEVTSRRILSPFISALDS
ncbi:unnamed protein product [Bursaphelenchus okinawaensis]|uniref:Uncharacterized protein n=1 Tax=Bursaphelenchus okinawaensis TaxID=465554 RepID=A0A811K7Y4_9BILA|nr:unnamed protein product [Bursaphelenchus okinawaensis]CAG9093630.1 unnamed protein product [Bursaphelenchus okinawaensis]